MSPGSTDAGTRPGPPDDSPGIPQPASSAPPASAAPPSEAHRMSRNFTLVVVAQFIAQILALVVSVSLARILGVDFYGIFVFGFAFPNWFLILLNFGFDSVTTIHVAPDHSKASEYLTGVVTLRIPLLVVTLVALAISLELAVSDPLVRLVTFLIGTASALGTFATSFATLFRAFERMEYVALVTIVGQVATAAAVLSLLLLGFGLVPVALVYLAVAILMTIATMWICRRRFAWLGRRVGRPFLVQILRETAPFGLQNVISTFVSTSAPVLLLLLASPMETGFFNAAFGLVNALTFPLSLYFVTVLPTMSRFYAGAPDKLELTLRKSHKLFFILGLPIALGGLFYREPIMVLFYGPQFAPSGASFGLLVLTLAIETATLGVGTALAASGHQTVNLVIGAVNVALILGLCFLLIPPFGPVGAALAFLVASLIGGILGMTMTHRLVAKVDILGTVSRPPIAGAAMIGVLYLLGDTHVLLGIAIGAAVYFAVLLLIKGVRRDDWALIRQIMRGALLR